MSNTEPVTKPSIGALLRDALIASPDADPEGAVDAVMVAIDPADYFHYLRELLFARVASEVGYLRSKNMPSIRRGVSTKQSLIRDEYWPRFLMQRISTPDGTKFLAEATVDDLRFVADMRKAQANDLLTRADEFSTLADLMVKAKVQYLEQLDPASASKVLRAAA